MERGELHSHETQADTEKIAEDHLALSAAVRGCGTAASAETGICGMGDAVDAALSDPDGDRSALSVLRDEIRREVPGAVAECRTAGIQGGYFFAWTAER